MQNYSPALKMYLKPPHEDILTIRPSFLSTIILKIQRKIVNILAPQKVYAHILPCSISSAQEMIPQSNTIDGVPLLHRISFIKLGLGIANHIVDSSKCIVDQDIQASFIIFFNLLKQTMNLVIIRMIHYYWNCLKKINIFSTS